MNTLFYRDGYAYQVAMDFSLNISPIVPLALIDTEFLSLDLLGNLCLKTGYAWNGADVVPDTKSVIRPSAVHDALYQCCREGWLDADVYRGAIDKLFASMCIEDGVQEALAVLYYQALRIGGGPAVDPIHARKIQFAP